MKVYVVLRSRDEAGIPFEDVDCVYATLEGAFSYVHNSITHDYGDTVEWLYIKPTVGSPTPTGDGTWYTANYVGRGEERVDAEFTIVTHVLEGA